MKIIYLILVLLILILFKSREEFKLTQILAENNDYLNSKKAVAEYYKKQKKYISNLPEEDIAVVKLYAGNNFFQAINSYQRGELDITKLPNGWYEDVTNYCDKAGILYNKQRGLSYEQLLFIIRYIINHLNRVIINAPPIITPIDVCRGFKTDYFIPKSGNIFLHFGFISLSVSREICFGFGTKGLLYSTLKPGTRALFVGNLISDEDEIILPSCTELIIKESIKESEDDDFTSYYVDFLEQEVCPIINLDKFYLSTNKEQNLDLYRRGSSCVIS